MCDSSIDCRCLVCTKESVLGPDLGELIFKLWFILMWKGRHGIYLIWEFINGLDFRTLSLFRMSNFSAIVIKKVELWRVENYYFYPCLLLRMISTIISIPRAIHQLLAICLAGLESGLQIYFYMTITLFNKIFGTKE